MDREFQIFASDQDNKIVHAGVHKARRANVKTARMLQRKWQVWRREYIANHPDQKMAGDRKVVWYFMYFIGDKPETGSYFRV